MIKAVVVCASFAGTAVSAQVLEDFDDLVHGEIVHGVSNGGIGIGAINPNRSFDIASAFDTTLEDTRDPDLEDPWSGGNLFGVTLGRVLIIAENDEGSDDGILDEPDDEGSRPAGQLIFEFNREIGEFGFDVVDIEGVVEEASSLEFYLAGDLVGMVNFTAFEDSDSDFFDPTVEFGNNHANRISPISGSAFGVSGFDRVVINVGGSAGFDTIVPAPGGIALLALGGLVAGRRRR